jgi:hypothetical protein
MTGAAVIAYATSAEAGLMGRGIDARARGPATHQRSATSPALLTVQPNSE